MHMLPLSASRVLRPVNPDEHAGGSSRSPLVIFRWVQRVFRLFLQISKNYDFDPPQPSASPLRQGGRRRRRRGDPIRNRILIPAHFLPEAITGFHCVTFFLLKLSEIYIQRYHFHGKD